jgi:hypothetical protein
MVLPREESCACCAAIAILTIRVSTKVFVAAGKGDGAPIDVDSQALTVPLVVVQDSYVVESFSL